MSAHQEGDAARATGRKRRQGGATQGSAPTSAADELWKRLKSGSAAPAAAGKGANLLAAITAPPAARVAGAEAAATSSRPVRVRRCWRYWCCALTATWSHRRG